MNGTCFYWCLYWNTRLCLYGITLSVLDRLSLWRSGFVCVLCLFLPGWDCCLCSWSNSSGICFCLYACVFIEMYLSLDCLVCRYSRVCRGSVCLWHQIRVWACLWTRHRLHRRRAGQGSLYQSCSWPIYILKALIYSNLHSARRTTGPIARACYVFLESFCFILRWRFTLRVGVFQSILLGSI